MRLPPRHEMRPDSPALHAEQLRFPNKTHGTLKHVPRALTPRGQGPCGLESRPLGGGTFLHPCVPPSICPAHNPETGLSRQPGRWRQHTRRWISEEGQARGGAPPGDELLGKEPGPPEELPSVYAALAATSPSQKPALIFPRVRPRITLVLEVETVSCSHRDLGDRKSVV